MEDDQQFCLRWNNHQSTLISVFDTLLENQTLVDCTLAAEGKFLKAHKVVLSACSPFFATLLQQQYDKHPIFILKDVKYQELRAMMDYMYRGEVNISQDQLAALLKAAESLQIKGLSDNRSGNTQKSEQHRGLNVPGSGNSGGKLSGYTLEQTQTKRPRVGPSMETTDLSASREGSSSPSRRRRKVRRRSVENAMPDVHDNSSSSQMNQSTIQPQQQHQQSQQSAANLTGIGALTAATSSLPAPAPVLPTGSSGVLGATGSIVSTQGTTQQMTPSITKKTESVKGISDAINTEAIQAVGGVVGAGDEQNLDNLKGEKSNHKQKSSAAGVVAKETTEMVIEPKSEYEEEGNEETVEDLTLDDEEMAMEDLDQNAGTSQAGEGSSQGYAPWQHDRSQDELLLAPQEAQQRDPQDLSRKFSQLHKENTSPQGVVIKTSCQRSILNTHSVKRLNVRNVTVTTETESELMSTLTRDIQTEIPLKQNISVNTNRKNMSMSDVSDMLIELYKANVANAPKNQQLIVEKLRQNSPSSAESNEPSSVAAIATKGASSSSVIESKSLQNNNMVTIIKEQEKRNSIDTSEVNAEIEITSSVPNIDNSKFHQSVEYTNIIKNTNNEKNFINNTNILSSISAIPVPVVVTPNSAQIDIKPFIHPTTGLVIPSISDQQSKSTDLSVIKTVPTIPPSLSTFSSVIEQAKSSMQGPVNNINSNSNSNSGVNVLPQAAAIAAALLRDGYNNFHQQLRTQELINGQGHTNRSECIDTIDNTNTANTISTKILENLLRQQRERRYKIENEINTDINPITGDGDGDDEDDSRYNDFDDIHLVENSKANYNNSTISGLFHPTASTSTARLTNSTNFDYMSDDSQKIMLAAQAQTLRNFEYSFSDNGNNSFGNMSNDTSTPNNDNDGIEAIYECRHCGKKYRWKSTLRRHENVECGGKEPSHQCPYCPYKSKQRGNLGVHVRKHHSDLPQLASKRRSKYSHKLDSSNNSANASDDSSSRLVIDCSK